MNNVIISISINFNNCLDIYSKDVEKLFIPNCKKKPTYYAPQCNYKNRKYIYRQDSECFYNDFNNDIYKYKREIIIKIYKDLLSIINGILTEGLNVNQDNQDKFILLNGSLTQSKDDNVLSKYENIVKNQFYCMDSCPNQNLYNSYFTKIWELSKYLISDSVNQKPDEYSWDNSDSTFDWDKIDDYNVRNTNKLLESKNKVKYKIIIAFNQINHLKRKLGNKQTQYYFMDNFDWANEYINNYIAPIVKLILQQSMFNRIYIETDNIHNKINRNIGDNIDELINDIDDDDLGLYFKTNKDKIIEKINKYVKSIDDDDDKLTNDENEDKLTNDENISYNIFKDFFIYSVLLKLIKYNKTFPNNKITNITDIYLIKYNWKELVNQIIHNYDLPKNLEKNIFEISILPVIKQNFTKLIFENILHNIYNIFNGIYF